MLCQLLDSFSYDTQNSELCWILDNIIFSQKIILFNIISRYGMRTTRHSVYTGFINRTVYQITSQSGTIPRARGPSLEPVGRYHLEFM